MANVDVEPDSKFRISSEKFFLRNRNFLETQTSNIM